MCRPHGGAALDLLVIEAVFADDEATTRPQHHVDLVRAHPTTLWKTAVLEAVLDGVREMDISMLGQAGQRFGCGRTCFHNDTGQGGMR